MKIKLTYKYTAQLFLSPSISLVECGQSERLCDPIDDNGSIVHGDKHLLQIGGIATGLARLLPAEELVGLGKGKKREITVEKVSA